MGFDYAKVNFGLINQTYPTDASPPAHSGPRTQWQRFARYVKKLNKDALDNVTYYGTPAWRCYWSKLEGNGTAVWADAKLTPDGVAQALKANAFWASQMKNEGMPAPQSFYTSPLSRCLATADLTFSGLQLPAGRPFVPIIKEFLREGVHIYTSARRASAAAIREAYPIFQFEPGFPEGLDPLWNGTFGEDESALRARSKIALDEIFTEDEATWVSITSHSDEITGLLSVLGHRPFGLSTGQIIPVLVKAERTYHAYPSTTIRSWQSEATCTRPPITSIPAVGCVCSGEPTATPTPK
ncbi:hypothetical protein DL765_001998 [Monosporascus sp. GIB2]|nr:hypothetical protein DL765_001998 [Monosporascus sp. GIB2]